MQSTAETLERKMPRPDREKEVDLGTIATELAQLEQHLDARNAAHQEARRAFGTRVETLAQGLFRVGAEPSPSASTLLEIVESEFGTWKAAIEDPDDRLRREILELRRKAASERVQLLDSVSQELDRAKVAFMEMEVRAEQLHEELEREAAATAEAEAAAARTAEQEEEANAKTFVSIPAVRVEPEPEPAVPAVEDGANRRQSARVTLACEVSLDTESNFYDGLAENISATGIFLASYDLLEVGSAVALSFTLPGSEVIETEAIVRWVRDPVDERSKLWPGMGLEFQDLDEAQQTAIAEFVKTREPLFFPDD